MPPKVCCCSVCQQLTFQLNGDTYIGKRVSHSTYAEHERADKRREQEARRQAQQQHEQQSHTVHVNVLPHEEEKEVPRQIDLESGVSLVTDMCYLLVAWLCLQGGASQSTANVVLRGFKFILHFIFKLFGLYLHAMGHSLDISEPNIPSDIHTVWDNIGFQPTISRTACCPTCFKNFPLNSLPTHCDFRKSPRSRPCREPLTTSLNTRNGPKTVPRRLFSTQSFESWLESFLKRPGIEDAMDKSFATPVAIDGERMQNVWQSPEWHRVQSWFSDRPNHS
ncbi:hypothetical protein K435DRAFT_871316 [Dendrothele bispora CBS 962.96]|uniref:Uncharacterized protein n=1 Tax=Dendrothele bispora (strain CBS 962.96) TaxID=1314807 RepID=A0A4S8L4R8_DENBC|nr:hypothetical protein K435DRAFT_871316 [Dendrothele bispora CBS 962.96]